METHHERDRHIAPSYQQWIQPASEFSGEFYPIQPVAPDAYQLMPHAMHGYAPETEPLNYAIAPHVVHYPMLPLSVDAAMSVPPTPFYYPSGPAFYEPGPIDAQAAAGNEPVVFELSSESCKALLARCDQLLPALSQHAVSYQALVAANPVDYHSDEQWHLTGAGAWAMIGGEEPEASYRPHIQRYCSDMTQALYQFLNCLLPGEISPHEAPHFQRLQGLCQQAAQLVQGQWEYHPNGAMTLTCASSRFSLIPIESPTSLASHLTDDLQLYPLAAYGVAPVSATVGLALFRCGVTIPLPSSASSGGVNPRWLAEGFRLGGPIHLMDRRQPLSGEQAWELKALAAAEEGHEFIVDMINSHLMQLPPSVSSISPLTRSQRPTGSDLRAVKPVEHVVVSPANESVIASSLSDSATDPEASDDEAGTAKSPKVVVEVNRRGPDSPADKSSEAEKHAHSLQDTTEQGAQAWQMVRRGRGVDSPSHAMSIGSPQPDESASILNAQASAPSADSPVSHGASDAESWSLMDTSLKLATASLSSTEYQRENRDSQSSSAGVAIKTEDRVAEDQAFSINSHASVTNTLKPALGPVLWESLDNYKKIRKWAKAQPTWAPSFIQQLIKEAPVSVRAIVCAYLIESFYEPLAKHQRYDGLLKSAEIMELLILGSVGTDTGFFEVNDQTLFQLEKYQVSPDPSSPKNNLIAALHKDDHEAAHIFATNRAKTWSSIEKELLMTYFASTPMRTIEFFNEMWRAGRSATDYMNVDVFEGAIRDFKDEASLVVMFAHASKALANEQSVLRYRQIMPIALKLHEPEHGWNELERLVSSIKRKKNADWDTLKQQLAIDQHIDGLFQKETLHWFFVQSDMKSILIDVLPEFPAFHTHMDRLNNQLSSLVDRFSTLSAHTGTCAMQSSELLSVIKSLTKIVFAEWSVHQRDERIENGMDVLAHASIDGVPLHVCIEEFITSASLTSQREIIENNRLAVLIRAVIASLSKRISTDDHDSQQQLAVSQLNFEISRYQLIDNRHEALAHIMKACENLSHLPSQLVYVCNHVPDLADPETHAEMGAVCAQFVEMVMRRESKHDIDRFQQVVLLLYFGDGTQASVVSRLNELNDTLRQSIGDSTFLDLAKGDPFTLAVVNKMQRLILDVPRCVIQRWPDEVVQRLYNLDQQQVLSILQSRR